MSKEILALNIDDVVVKHVEGFVTWSNATYGTRLTPDDYTEAWHELWEIDKEQVEARKKIFFTDEIVGAFKVVGNAGAGIIALSGIRKIVGVTSRRESLRSVTEEALNIIAPGAVQELVFATSFRDGQRITRSKAAICQEIGASDIIDDHLEHCLDVSKVGVRAVLFGDYVWNQSYDELPQNVSRAKDWPEVLAHFGVQPPNNQ